MPIHLNQIGSFEFMDLIGPIGGRQERVELFERPGVQGHGARKNKIAGVPFPLISVRYVEDFASAATEFSTALALTGTLVTVKRQSVDYGTFLVLDVQENTPPQAVSFAIGGVTSQQATAESLIYSDLEVRTELRWTLLWNADPTP